MEIYKKMHKVCFKIITLFFIFALGFLPVCAENKQQIETFDAKGNKVFITPSYQNYNERNENVSEKIVAIYDKRSPAYGYQYVLYTPIGHYVGHKKRMQHSLNGYSPIPDGGDGSQTPCFKSIQEAKHYYYPQWY